MTLAAWGVRAAIGVAVAVGLWAYFCRRVRVRVKPVRLEDRGSGVPVGLGIEIRNRSGFPVTINEVGYVLSGGTPARIARAVTLEERPLPARLAPGARLTVRGDLGESDMRVLRRAEQAYVVTSCGKRATGTSLDLRRTTAFADRLFQPPSTP